VICFFSPAKRSNWLGSSAADREEFAANSERDLTPGRLKQLQRRAEALQEEKARQRELVRPLRMR
jgi:hypothetical protein